MRDRDRLARERDQVVVALERTGTAVVIVETAASEPRLNEAARFLLADVVDAEQALHQVIARPGSTMSFRTMSTSSWLPATLRSCTADPAIRDPKAER
jgi:hypothetical protein